MSIHVYDCISWPLQLFLVWILLYFCCASLLFTGESEVFHCELNFES